MDAMEALQIISRLTALQMWALMNVVAHGRLAMPMVVAEQMSCLGVVRIVAATAGPGGDEAVLAIMTEKGLNVLEAVDQETELGWWSAYQSGKSQHEMLAPFCAVKSTESATA